jgi:hypothetical protein
VTARRRLRDALAKARTEDRSALTEDRKALVEHASAYWPAARISRETSEMVDGEAAKASQPAIGEVPTPSDAAEQAQRELEAEVVRQTAEAAEWARREPAPNGGVTVAAAQARQEAAAEAAREIAAAVEQVRREVAEEGARQAAEAAEQVRRQVAEEAARQIAAAAEQARREPAPNGGVTVAAAQARQEAAAEAAQEIAAAVEQVRREVAEEAARQAAEAAAQVRRQVAEEAAREIAAAAEQARREARQEAARQAAEAAERARQKEMESGSRLTSETAPETTPGHDVRTCRIERWRGYRTSRFYVATADGFLLESKPFRWRDASTPPEAEAARAAYDWLVARLEARGWMRSGDGEPWYATTFTLMVEAPGETTPGQEPEGVDAFAPGPPTEEAAERREAGPARPPATPVLAAAEDQPSEPLGMRSRRTQVTEARSSTAEFSQRAGAARPDRSASDSSG